MKLIITVDDVYDFIEDTGIKTNGIISTEILERIYLDMFTYMIGGLSGLSLSEFIRFRLECFCGTVRYCILLSEFRELINVKIFTD